MSKQICKVVAQKDDGSKDVSIGCCLVSIGFPLGGLFKPHSYHVRTLASFRAVRWIALLVCGCG